MTVNKSEFIGLSEGVCKKICSVFAKYNQVKKVILYGSRAKGNYRSGSDIDLCIEGESLDLTRLLKIENEIDDLLLPWKIDLSIKDKIDNPKLLQHINDHGLVFYSAET